MDTLRGLFESFMDWWRELQPSSRMGLVIAGVAAIAAVTGVGMWSSRPQYTTLANDLAPGEAAELVSKLDAENIDHKLNFSASAVLVPKHQISQARMLVGDRTVEGGSEEWNESILGDPGLNRFKMNKHLERNLAASIRRMNGIADATVHIARPETSPFVDMHEPPTASVVLEFQSGATATRESIEAIIAIVAQGVEGLDPADVSLMDTRGRLLGTGGGGVGSVVSSQFDHRRRMEASKAAKANSMLSGLLGERRSIVRVTADIDFTRLERTETKYDPESKTAVSEEITSDKTTSGSPQARGPAGVNSLGIRGNRTTNSIPTDSQKETSTITYVNGETVNSIVEEPGKIRRLTIAVLADVTPAATSSEAEDQEAPPPLATKEAIEDIVKNAVGFDADRGDRISVVLTPLAGFETEGEQLVKSQQWDFYERILRNSSLGIASLVALILGLLTLLRVRPITVTPSPEQQPNELLSEFTEQVRQNPDVVKAVVSAWLDDEAPSETEEKRAA